MEAGERDRLADAVRRPRGVNARHLRHSLRSRDARAPPFPPVVLCRLAWLP